MNLAVYLKVVTSLENIVEDLKTLPQERLDEVAKFIQQLKPVASLEERQAALDRTFGCLSQEEADDLMRAIEEGCERIR